MFRWIAWAILLGLAWNVPAWAQTSVCEIFQDLPASSGKQVSIHGDLFLDSKLSALAADSCGDDLLIGADIRSTVINLRPSPNLPSAKVKEYEDVFAQTARIRSQGRLPRVTATFSGRLSLTGGTFPAEILFDDFHDIKVEALLPANELPVVNICDLFKDLKAWKDKRIAIQAQQFGTDEGTWIFGDCKDHFVTKGMSWPTSLSLGTPANYLGEALESSFGRDVDSIKDAYRKAAEQARGRQSVSTVVTLAGKVRVRDEYFSECRNGEWEGIGFGHLSGAPAELIVEAVREIKVVPLIPRTKSAEVKCRPPDFDEKCRTLTTLIEAADAGCVDKVRQILAVFGIDAQAGKRSEALDFAIRSDHVEVVKMLLEHKAPVNPTVGDEDPPLHSAAWFHHLEILRLLIKAGAKVDAENDHGETFLASFGYFDTDVARELLEAGANPNARDRNNATPLMRAASYGFEGMVRLLLDHGANVDLTDKDGRTALMYAAKGNDIERQYYIDAIPLLLAKKADYRKRDKSGQTAFDIAVKSKHSYAVDLLNDAGLKRAPR